MGSRFTLTIDFDDSVSDDSPNDGILFTQLAASLAVSMLRDCPSITIGDVELVDHDSVTELEDTSLTPCEVTS